MSLEYQWPSSSGLEIEARQLHATPQSEGFEDLGLVEALGRFPQAFGLAASGFAAAFVFPQLFFPNLSLGAGLLASLAIFALAPLVGALPNPLFGLVERRHGRGVRATAARVMLGGSTALIAFLPGAGQIGLAAVALLIGCRLLQGLAGTGLSRSSGVRRITVGDLAGAAVALTLCCGLLLALPRADFLAWGWRYPFMMAMACNIVGLFADLRRLGTPGAAATGGPALRLVAENGVRVGGGKA